MQRIQFFYIAIITILFTGCKSDIDLFNKNYKLELTNSSPSFKNGSTINLSVIDASEIGIDSIQWFENAGIIDGENSNTLSRKLTKNSPLGEIVYEAHIYKNGSYAIATTSIKRMPETAPKVITYEVVARYPHQTESYTQGLEFFEGKLYESTGQYMESDLRITDYKTGETLQKVTLPDHIFAEGMTILNGKIYQLTWKAGYGYVYNTNLEKIDQFKYGRSKDGWGLTNDGTTLFKSDGTDKIWRLNPNTYEEEGYLQVVSNKKSFININELEYIDGKIFANSYLSNGIMIINPNNGTLEGVIDLTALTKEIPNFSKKDNVLNGIAYDAATGHLFVTGKRWNTLFEIKINQ